MSVIIGTNGLDCRFSHFMFEGPLLKTNRGRLRDQVWYGAALGRKPVAFQHEMAKTTVEAKQHQKNRKEGPNLSFKIDNKTTYFGYKKVPINEKTQLVSEVFHSVANKYDLMNDLMSFGLHRLWKQFLIREAALKPKDVVLDVAGGTGDLTKAYAKTLGPLGKVVLSDINETMLQTGRERLIDAGLLGKFECVQADAECLPFVDHHFDCVSIAFGLRNVTDKIRALSSMYRVLKPGGKLLILEFSHPTSSKLNQLYDWYSFNIIPKMGDFIANDRDSYQYLVESIRMHPNQESLKQMMLESGFEDVEYFNLTGGIVALHKGYKY